MVEVDKHNFEQLFETIVTECEHADFIAFDLEYTGIELKKQGKYSLFQSSHDRYSSLRECLQQTTTIQIGLSLFQRKQISAAKFKFSASVYSFVLMPPAYEPLKTEFVCSSSALEFLRTHGLDFNKVIDSGISFLNEAELKILHSTFDDSDDRLEHFQENQENNFLEQCSQIYAWQEKGGELDDLILDPIAGVTSFQHQAVLRNKFSDIWTEKFGDNKIRVYKIESSNRNMKELNEMRMHPSSSRYQFQNELMGFSRLFKKLIDLKKPMVGHNCFLDFIAMYGKFYKSLPLDFHDYAYSLHRLFPVIYDTKNIIYRVRQLIPTLSTGSLGLATVYEKLIAANVDRGPCGVQISTDSELYNVREASKFAHEAGFDAYMAGVVLLLLGHNLYLRDKKLAEFSTTIQAAEIGYGGPSLSPSFYAYQHHLEPYVNTLNLIRAREDSIILGTSQSPLQSNFSRPPYLIIRKRLQPLSQSAENDLVETDVTSLAQVTCDSQGDSGIFEDFQLTQQSVADLLAEYGQADVRRLVNSTKSSILGPTFLIAMSSHSGARAVIREFKSHPFLCVRKYSPLKDNRLIQNSVLGAAILSTTLSGIALASIFIGT